MAKAKQTPFQHLRAVALAYPETREDLPWGESAIKVRGKTFVFMRDAAEEFSVTMKLPQSREFALEYPFTAPTAYGLGKTGWVTSRFAPKDKPPIDVLEAWISESYRAVAPKTLVKQLVPRHRGRARRALTLPNRAKAVHLPDKNHLFDPGGTAGAPTRSKRDVSL